MSLLRLAVTSAVMAATAVVLAALTPDVSDMARAVAAPQRTTDTAGPDQLVLAAAGLLAWTVWAWGSLGLTVTAAAAAPGLLGSAARVLQHGLLPRGVRRTAALALGIGLGATGPLLVPAVGLTPLPAAIAAPADGVPDWPSPAPVTGVPDWPAANTHDDRTHLVVPGDCLWRIAEGRLVDHVGHPPTDGEVAAAVAGWWAANTGVIGSDPDLLLPGQVLRPPP
ncbi:hypothetical protein [Blastococcus sp. PRF04-17]|uniref:hypothetical protein n=1 Tax=Blastococcus sp. PRF04-17 TaxID=2933797 RepID=UPI001FF368B8|nr:hypothetical protein [Blastococcus sp. PRF04-17]UOY01263.1 hypothetical protein MVA48_20295 [Blastococcus sp. PRF04-17]